MDQSSTVDVLSLGLGKLAGKKGSSKGSLDQLIGKVFANETKAFANWNLFPDISLNDADGILKVIFSNY